MTFVRENLINISKVLYPKTAQLIDKVQERYWVKTAHFARFVYQKPAIFNHIKMYILVFLNVRQNIIYIFI